MAKFPTRWLCILPLAFSSMLVMASEDNLLTKDNVINLSVANTYSDKLKQTCKRYLKGQSASSCVSSCGKMDDVLEGISAQLSRQPIDHVTKKKAYQLYVNRLKQCVSTWPNRKNLPLALKPFFIFIKAVQSGIKPIPASIAQGPKPTQSPVPVLKKPKQQPTKQQRPAEKPVHKPRESVNASPTARMCGTWELEEHLLYGHLYADSFLNGCTPHFYGHEQFIIAGIANGVKANCKIKLPKEMMQPITAFVNKLNILKNSNKPVDRGLPSAQISSQKRVQYFSSGESRVSTAEGCAAKGEKYLTRIYETLLVYPEAAKTAEKICGVYPIDQYPKLINDIRQGCSRQFEGVEQLFLAGAADVVLSCPSLDLPTDVSKSMFSFIASQVIVRDATMPRGVGKSDVIKNQGQRTAHYALGAKAAKEILGCNKRGKEFVISLDETLDIKTTHPNQPNFVSGCVDYYQGEYGFNKRKCSCAADILRALYPDIHTRHFDTQLFKQMPKQNPILSTQMIVQCGLNKY